MPAFTFDKCCFCIDLRVGCLIIGYLNLIAEIIAFILGIVLLTAGGVIVNKAEGEDKQTIEAAGTVLMIASIIVIFAIAVFFALTIALLVGVHQEKRGHVKAYLVGTVIILVLGLIGTLMQIGSVSGGEIAKNLISVVISVYFLLCIRSYYYKMDERRPAYVEKA